jgi:hypothetical protein
MGLPYMQGAIRQQEMPRSTPNNGFFSRSSGSRSFLRYGYGDLLTEDRRLQNAAPHLARHATPVAGWGDPEMAAGYGRVSSFCGSAGRGNLMEPLSLQRPQRLRPAGRPRRLRGRLTERRRYDFEKYLYYAYRVWGRNLYQSGRRQRMDWRRTLGHNRFGRGAGIGGTRRSSSASRRFFRSSLTAHCPSAANNNYWPEMYWNMPIVECEPPASLQRYGRIRNGFGNVSPLDPEFFLEHVMSLPMSCSKARASGKYSPAWVAESIGCADGTIAAILPIASTAQIKSARRQQR